MASEIWTKMCTVDVVQVKPHHSRCNTGKNEHITISFLKKTINYMSQRSRGKKWWETSLKYSSIHVKEK